MFLCELQILPRLPALPGRAHGQGLSLDHLREASSPTSWGVVHSSFGIDLAVYSTFFFFADCMLFTRLGASSLMLGWVVIAFLFQLLIFRCLFSSLVSLHVRFSVLGYSSLVAVNVFVVC